MEPKAINFDAIGGLGTQMQGLALEGAKMRERKDEQVALQNFRKDTLDLQAKTQEDTSQFHKGTLELQTQTQKDTQEAHKGTLALQERETKLKENTASSPEAALKSAQATKQLEDLNKQRAHDKQLISLDGFIEKSGAPKDIAMKVLQENKTAMGLDWNGENEISNGDTRKIQEYLGHNPEVMIPHIVSHYNGLQENITAVKDDIAQKEATKKPSSKIPSENAKIEVANAKVQASIDEKKKELSGLESKGIAAREAMNHLGEIGKGKDRMLQFEINNPDWLEKQSTEVQSMWKMAKISGKDEKFWEAYTKMSEEKAKQVTAHVNKMSETAATEKMKTGKWAKGDNVLGDDGKYYKEFYNDKTMETIRVELKGQPLKPATEKPASKLEEAIKGDTKKSKPSGKVVSSLNEVKEGDEYNGHIYIGGDKSKKESWKAK